MSLWNSSCILSALSLATDVRFQQPYFCQKFLVYSPLFLALGSLSTILGFWQPCLFQKFSIFSVLSCTTALGIASPVFLKQFLGFSTLFLATFISSVSPGLCIRSWIFQPYPKLQTFLSFVSLVPCNSSWLLVLALDLSALFLSTDLSFLISCNSSYFFKQVFVQIFLILSAGSLKTIPAFLASLLQEILSGFNSYKISCS